MAFLLLFILRVASGVQNGLGYARLHRARTASSLLLGVSIILSSLWFMHTYHVPALQRYIAYLFMVLAAAGAVGVEDSFNEHLHIFPKDIHLYETIFGYALPLMFIVAGADLIQVACSTYPALIIHKAAINLGSGQRWDYHGTDSHTGTTFYIPLLGIHIPRLSTKLRIALAITSIVIVLLAALLRIKFTAWPLSWQVG